MHAIMLGVAWWTVGLDVGWRPLSGGGIEYTIQIAPAELELFKQNGLEGDVPPHLRDIRCYRIVVGNEVLARQDPPKPPAVAAVTSPGKTNDRAAPPKDKDAFASRDAPRADEGRVAAPIGGPATPFAKPQGVPPDRVEDGRVTAPVGPATPFVKPQGVPPGTKPKDFSPAPKETSAEMPRSLGAMGVVMVALLGSLGGNLYLGWITWETRARYHALVRRRTRAGAYSEDSRPDDDVEVAEDEVEEDDFPDDKDDQY